MTKKKDKNTQLLLLGGSAAALYLFSTKKNEPMIAGQTVPSIFKKYGIVDGIEYIIEKIDSWNEDPRSPVYAKLYEMAHLTYDMVVDLSKASSEMFNKIYDGYNTGTITFISGIAGQYSTLNAVKNVIKSIYDKQLIKQKEVTEYIKASPGVDLARYKTVIIQLLEITRANYKAVETYKSSWGSYVLNAVNAVGSALDSVWKAISGVGRMAIMLFKYAPYIVLGLGGIWAYNNFKGQVT